MQRCEPGQSLSVAQNRPPSGWPPSLSSWQTPLMHAKPWPQSLSVAHEMPPSAQLKPSSTRPLQSLSMPSQTSALGVQPMTLHVPLTQAWPAAHCASVVQLLVCGVQTPDTQACDAGQSLSALHAVPLAGWKVVKPSTLKLTVLPLT